MNVQEDFIRCSCGCADFKEDRILTFRNTVKSRDTKRIPLPYMEEEFRYFCRQCDKELVK